VLVTVGPRARWSEIEQRDHCREKQADQRERPRQRAEPGQVERERRRGGEQQRGGGNLIAARSGDRASAGTLALTWPMPKHSELRSAKATATPRTPAAAAPLMILRVGVSGISGITQTLRQLLFFAMFLFNSSTEFLQGKAASSFASAKIISPHRGLHDFRRMRSSAAFVPCRNSVTTC